MPMYDDMNVNWYADLQSGIGVEAGKPRDPNYVLIGWGLDVELQGKRHRLKISTDTDGVTLKRKYANALGLATGSGHTAHVNAITAEGFAFTECDITVVDNDDLDASIDGTIGLEMLRQDEVTLDLQAMS